MRNDVVKGVYSRLGLVGVSLLASAVLFGAIAGGVVVHRLESSPTASNTQEHNSQSDESGDGQSKHKPSSHPAHPAHPSPEPNDDQDKDT